MRSLVEHLRAEVPEFRSKEALAYPIAGFLALIALAMFSGVRRGPQDLAEYAASLSQGQLRALGFRTNRHTGQVRCPGESTFKRLLPQIDATALERALLLWQEQVLGPSQDKLAIVDGKTLRHAHVELVNAVDGSGRWLGTVGVKEGSNEIPAARELLGKVPVAGKTTLADAIHTQKETAREILFDGGGDYALDVSLDEDRSRVRNPNAALVLGMFRRLVVSVAQTAIAQVQTKKTRWSVRRYQQQFGRRDGGSQRLDALVFSKNPSSWRLKK